eukprot:TRINITY_DN20322_c0_g1_i2.p1 TRINITY_DN20322_c0_g1~~TRINITY_DN20322_c0_g1_i2.p1  ORF type:complete len:200 (+),score=11.36 TRINITY_DN20322_c0_g1_i2:430-1029(+)
MRRSPHFSIGTSQRSGTRSQGTPGPSAYRVQSGFKTQTESYRPSSASCSIGSAPRCASTVKAYCESMHDISKDLKKGAGAKIGSKQRFESANRFDSTPGVGHYKIKSFVGKQAVWGHRTAPASSFGERHPHRTDSSAPGPGYLCQGGLGHKEVSARKQTTARFSIPCQPRFSGYGTCNPGYGRIGDTGPGPGAYNLQGS